MQSEGVGTYSVVEGTRKATIMTHWHSDSSNIIEINSQRQIYSLVFVEDGKQIISGSAEGFLRRWQIDDGHEVGEAIPVEGGGEIFAVALSPNRKWLICGVRFSSGNNKTGRVGVWNAQTREKALDVHHHTNTVLSVDISPDSMKFATGGYDKVVLIWGMVTGEKLVGPLQHEGIVVAVRFSPNGGRIATATHKNPGAESIRIYNSDDGQQLLDIPFSVQTCPLSPLAWTADGRQLFAVSFSEIKCFDMSSGSLLSKWSINNAGYPASIALARNQKFIVVSAYDSLSFWDTSTHQQLGTVIQLAGMVWSLALSPNDDCIATGGENGKITLRSLRNILPGSYFTVNVSGYTW